VQLENELCTGLSKQDELTTNLGGLMMPDHYWEYFLAIEDDLVKTSRYVEFNQDNYNTYSIEFARIILASSSEVDVIAKLLYPPIYKDGKEINRTICHHKKGITPRFPRFTTMEINVPKYGLTLQPWQDWLTNKSPFWWKSYNNVKHHRDQSYKEATLKNALYSVAGLLCIVLYYHKHGKNISYFDTQPQLLHPEWYENFEPASLSWPFTLPD
jgi:hypothetical protein